MTASLLDLPKLVLLKRSTIIRIVSVIAKVSSNHKGDTNHFCQFGTCSSNDYYLSTLSWSLVTNNSVNSHSLAVGMTCVPQLFSGSMGENNSVNLTTCCRNDLRPRTLTGSLGANNSVNSTTCGRNDLRPRTLIGILGAIG